MTDASLLNLFHPGNGRIPPYLAGRDAEKVRFDAIVMNLSNSNAADRDMIVCGPRGNGKTAMLRYFADNCVCEGIQPSIVWMTPNNMRSLEDMTRAMADQDKGLLDRFSPVAASLDLGIAKISTEVAVVQRSSFFQEILGSLCSRIPTVLIVDEAHNLDPGIAGDLLNASQMVRANPNTPFFLVLAGTPGLVPLLQQANASFWERSHLVELGRLTLEDATAALAVPLADAGVFIDREIAVDVAGRAHYYPYFIQVWGHEIASYLHDSGESVVSASTIAEVESTVNDMIKTIYRVRRDEIQKMGLSNISLKVAKYFLEDGKDRVLDVNMEEIIRQAHMDLGMDTKDSSVMETRTKLVSIGFIWGMSPKGSMSIYYEAGIPSLMNYVMDKSLKSDMDENLGKQVPTKRQGLKRRL